VSLAFGGPVDGDGVLLERFDGPIVGPLSGVKLDLGQGLGGKVASLQRLIVVNDYVRTDHITHRYDQIIQAEGLRSMVAVPVVVSKKTVAVLYGAFRDTQMIGGRIGDVIVHEARALEQNLVAADVMDGAALTKNDALLAENRQLRVLLSETQSRLRLLASRSEDAELRDALLQEADRFSTDSAAEPESTVPETKLTARERDVLGLVASGLTNVRIGEILGLTTATVKSYMKNIMGKLDAATRHESVVIARQLGLLS